MSTISKITITVIIFMVISTFAVNSDLIYNIFTLGKPSSFLIYIRNRGLETDSYTITYQKEYTYHGDDLSHLIDIHFVSNEIENLEPGRIRVTQGTITILGSILSEGTITFITTSENTGYQDQKVIRVSGNASRLISLPEFSLLGFLQLFFLAGLIIFYSFHIN